MSHSSTIRLKNSRCSPDAMKRMLQKHPNLLLAFTQPGCGACAELKSIVKEVNPKLGNLAIAEVSLPGDAVCEAFADFNKVSATPTLVHFRNGKAVKKWLTTGDREKDTALLLKAAGTSSKTKPIKKRKK